MPDRIDYQFISRLEGDSKQTGYVPAAGQSRSGVTVATGFDLGQRAEADLKRLGLSSNLISKLKPYLGIQGQAAVNLVKKSPLKLSRNEVQAIDNAVYQDELSALRRTYNQSSQNASGKKFLKLPKEAQTVIFSVAHQYGTGLNTRAPSFWKLVCAQNWGKAVKELKNFGDNFPTRRHKEARVLKRLVRKQP